MDLRRPGLAYDTALAVTCPAHHHDLRVPARGSRRAGAVLAVVLAAAMSACSSDTPAPPPVNAAPAAVNTPIDAYRTYYRIADAAARNPLSEDWSLQLSAYSVDPERSNGISTWKHFRDLGVIFSGETTLLNPQITQQSATTATLSDCQNTSKITAAQNGRPLPKPSDQLEQAQVNATIKLDGNTWKVSDLQYFRDRPC